VAAPSTTVDLACEGGNSIPIRERDINEVTNWFGIRIAPQGIDVYNPVFDVTDASLISAIITEKGIVHPPYTENLCKVFEKQCEGGFYNMLTLNNKITPDQIYNVANRIRIRVLEHTIKNKGGYLSQACSSAEVFATLYTAVLNLGKVEKPLVPKPFSGIPGPFNADHSTGAYFNGPNAPEYDRFFLSPSQYSLILYATLIEVGRMAQEALDYFNVDGSSVEMIGAEHSPGMEIMSGSLGQAISQAAGIAMARKIKKEKGRVVLFLSDGECQPGQFWEAVQTISFYRLDNMIAYVDANGYQADGKMANVMNIEPLEKRLEAFGARVFRVNGHNVEVLYVLSRLEPDGRPTFIICDTDPSRGIEILKRRIPKLHYVRFSSTDEILQYKEELEKMKSNIKT